MSRPLHKVTVYLTAEEYAVMKVALREIKLPYFDLRNNRGKEVKKDE